MERLFHRLLIANRGEVAVRVARTCDELGIVPVFAVSEADAAAPYTDGRETVVLGPGAAAQSYLDMERVIQAAVQSRCTALHPGWGFLSENSRFAALCEQRGVTFIGPPAHAMQLMGKKSPAKRAMVAAGLDVIPGSDGVLDSAEQAREVADQVGYPVLLKAESGGGGRGMRVVRSADEIADAYGQASAEARGAFGDPRLYLEKLIEGGRHVEIQVMADRYGNAVHIGERDCTVQRNHQKLVEESPSPALDDELRKRTCEAAAAAAARIGYVGAGTFEFLLDEGGVLRFMEMNTRLQVEHTVSEVRSGLDLVALQIRVAAGQPLAISQSDISLEGHAIELRINAEDPANRFKPSPGTITRWQPPSADELSAKVGGAGESWLRIDTHVAEGYTVPPHYDSLICKIITSGPDRKTAIDRMLAALEHFGVEGVETTIPMHQSILSSSDFASGSYDTRTIPGWNTEDH